MAVIKFKPKNKIIFQFRIDLRGAKPPIWRRVQVYENISFFELHMIIQCCFDWENSHLHQFFIDRNTIIADINQEYHEPLYDNEYDEYKIKLNEIFKSESDTIMYEYDFGDSWNHMVKLEKILTEDKRPHYPYLVTGKKVAPFEDSGGIWGWQDICEAQFDKTFPDRDEIIEWSGEFDPNDFGKESINEINEIFSNWEEYLKKTKELMDLY